MLKIPFKKVLLAWVSFALLFLLKGLTSYAQAPQDSAMAALDAKLDEYFSALTRESTKVKIEESDFLISSCTTVPVRNHVAIRVYDHFLQSKIMGDEAVVVHLVDKWFEPGKASFNSDDDLMNAKIFAMFNRQSLIGNKAPSLLLKTIDGMKVEALGLSEGGFAAPSERYRILYFYAPDCATCKIESVLMTKMLSEEALPVDLIAVNTKDNEEEWRQYREERLMVRSSVTRVMHYWDPEVDSDFQIKYGVLQTPKLLLIDPSGTIIGRGLDTEALKTLLLTYVKQESLQYGTDESSIFYDNVFEPLGSDITGEDVISTAKYIESSTLGAGQPRLFRQMCGDLLYYLTLKREEAYKEGLEYVVDSLVLARPDVWNTPDDTMKVVTMATIEKNMLSRTPVGKRLPSLKVHGDMRTWKGKKYGQYDISKIGSPYSYILIYTEGCGHCEEELAGVDAILTSFNSPDRQVKKVAKKTKVLVINLDTLMSNFPDEAYSLLDTFDLTALPYAVALSKDGTVLHKYMSFME